MNMRIEHPILVLKKLAAILLGTFIYSAGISLFLDPNSIAPGGVVGISVILSHAVGMPTGTWYFLINIPIIILGWWKFGSRFISYCFYAVALNSVFTNILRLLPPVTDNLLLAAIAGSILIGCGIGIVLKVGATTGGTDIIIKVLRRRFKAIKTSTLFLLIDMSIVAASGITFRDFNTAMYAFIAVVLNEKVLDYVLYGRDEAKLIYIVSKTPKSIVERIIKDLEIGATILTGQGAYSREEKQVIMCVIKKQQAPHLEQVIIEEDKDAFMIVSSASEIYGEGYKNILSDKL